ncbi:hypothetical protein AVEN_176647-1 [Araneus ventricosus]|uniref:Uncharacterized protein n=1 Tax=Araneus ventricosus TaxID=182803 RepID=A0A4Y2L271_ARAVE|nr:hypothetical protein AVEN_176647-1 [Araneus ventricosus]
MIICAVKRDLLTWKVTVEDSFSPEVDCSDDPLYGKATPLENGFRSSESLMGRRINTTLPLLRPYSVNKKVLEAKEEKRMGRPEKEL